LRTLETGIANYLRIKHQPDATLSSWAESTPVILDGRPFTFHKHEFLRLPYTDTHPNQVELKAAQMGLTTKAMLRAFYGAKYGGYKGILYLFPSKTDVLDFSRGRISPLIDDNPDTLGTWISDTDAAGIKRVDTAMLYLRGMVSTVGLKSIPVDLIVFDELDEAPQDRIAMAMQRMGHSEFRESLKLSNPTLPDYGIDKAWQETDQRYWLLKCPGCGHYNNLTEIFMEYKPPEIPRCFKVVGDQVLRVCEKCETELDLDAGEWVARRPRVTEVRGYHYSQLFSHFVPAAEILKAFQTADNLRDLYNLQIGVAWIEAENRLSVEEVLALCGNEGIASSDPGPCYMGVDQGKDLHVVIGKRGGGRDRIVHLEIYRDWEEIDDLMNRFNVARCVVDALPETRNAREFAKRFRGRVFLNYYLRHQKGAYKWNEKDLTVACNRTESLDASHAEISKAQVGLPRESAITREFAKQLHNVAKKLEEDEDTGSKEYVYVKLGVEHFRHAFNYEVMARSYGKVAFWEGCDL
jgi:hypothetical protein